MTTTAGPNDCGDPKDQDSLWLGVQRRVQDVQQQCQDISQGFFVMGEGTSTTTNYLLVATDRITGIECPKLWDGTVTPHYWELAWKVAKRSLQKYQDRIGMAINAKYNHNDQPIRNFNQLHIHVSCIQTEVQNYLQQNDSQITREPAEWKKAPLLQIPPITGHAYRVLCLVKDDDITQKHLFKLVRDVVGNDPDMQYQTLVVARRKIAGKTAGFYVLNSQSKGMPNGTGAGEMNLLDEKCS